MNRLSCKGLTGFAWAGKGEHYDGYSIPLMITLSLFIVLLLLAHIYRAPYAALNLLKRNVCIFVLWILRRLHFCTLDLKKELTSVYFENLNPTALWK
jgi:hypothetical protein